MVTVKKLAFVSLLAFGVAAPGIAAADHRRDARRVELGNVGTQVHEHDDQVAVTPAVRLESVQLRARGGSVALAGVRILFANGSTQFADVERLLRPRETISIDIANRAEPIETLVLIYSNAGPYKQAPDTAQVQVRGVRAERNRDGLWRQLAGRSLADDRVGVQVR